MDKTLFNSKTPLKGQTPPKRRTSLEGKIFLKSPGAIGSNCSQQGTKDKV